MRITISIVFAVLCLASAFGQSGDKKKSAKADKMYEKLGYREAIDLYRQGKLDLSAMERMANSYRLNGDTYNAERWYSQIVAVSDEPINLLYYAQALHSNGRYEQAKDYYLRYDRTMGRGSDQRGKLLAEAIDHQRDFRSKKAAEVVNEAAVNGVKLDFSPAFYENGIVFVSTREPEGGLKKQAKGKDYWTGDDFAALYFAPADAQGRLGKPAVFGESLSSQFHEGPITFSRTGDQLFFTRNKVKNSAWNVIRQMAGGKDELKLKIYVAEKSGDAWGEPVLLDLKDAAANDAHPAIAPDGQTLYFSSDREGGYGGMDLYQVSFENGAWGAPVNLGGEVNTPGNELFPFVHDDGTLYFASDGWQGLGGLDLFYAEKSESGKWTVPENLGEPFNSPKDDFGYILDVLGTKGYFTSARDGGAGRDDLYSFSLPQPQANKKGGRNQSLTLCVTDAATGERMPGAKVTILEQLPEGGYQGYEDDLLLKLVPTSVPGEYAISLKRRDPFASAPAETETFTTDENGSFATKLDPEKQYLFRVKKEGFQEISEVVGGESLAAMLEKKEYCFPLAASDCISLGGRVLNKRYQNPIPTATVTLINLCTGDLLTVQSDAEGRYDFPCIPCNCDFIVQGSKPNFKQDNNLASTTDMDCAALAGERIEKDLLLMPTLDKNGQPAQASYHPDDNERPIGEYATKSGKPSASDLEDPDLLDRVLSDGLTIELENIYYDFDKYNIRPDAAIELDKVVDVMRRHPDLVVELRSHTDVRGTDGYNETLSANRAKSAVDYIVKRGISRSRITSKGYGETWLTNECQNDVPCDEPDHQMNRRTEIKVWKR